MAFLPMPQKSRDNTCGIRLGWRAENIEVIDADLGLTGASAQHRSGFQELVTKAHAMRNEFDL